jgi:hypothetical protein
LSFDGKKFSLKEPHLGNFKNYYMESKGLFDHLAVPPCGVNMDPKIVTLEKVQDGGVNSVYPHIYIPLIHYSGDKSQLIPAMDDGSCVQLSRSRHLL